MVDTIRVGVARPKPRRERHSTSGLGILYVEEAARELCISTSATYELIRRGKLKALRMGAKLLRVRRADMEAFVADPRGGESR